MIVGGSFSRTQETSGAHDIKTRAGQSFLRRMPGAVLRLRLVIPFVLRGFAIGVVESSRSFPFLVLDNYLFISTHLPMSISLCLYLYLCCLAFHLNSSGPVEVLFYANTFERVSCLCSR